MKLKLQSSSDNAIQIQIDREDYSIADIVHRELLNVKHVKFAGVPPPHPLIKTLTIQLRTDGADPKAVLADALALSQKRVGELLKLSLEIFPRAPKSSPVEKSSEGRPESDAESIGADSNISVDQQSSAGAEKSSSSSSSAETGITA